MFAGAKQRWERWRDVAPPSAEIALSESAWVRARRAGRARCLSLSFLIVEVVVTAAASAVLGAWLGVAAFFALIAVVFFYSLWAAGVEQRDEARAALAEVRQARASQEDVATVERELSIAWTEAEAFFGGGIDQIFGLEPWQDWEGKTAGFLAVVFGQAARASFEAAGEDYPAWDLLVHHRRDVLIDLAKDLSADKIRLTGEDLEQAIAARRDNEGLPWKVHEGEVQMKAKVDSAPGGDRRG